jgi:hypothetical protein
MNPRTPERFTTSIILALILGQSMAWAEPSGADLVQSCMAEPESGGSAICLGIIAGFVIGYQNAGNIASKELPIILQEIPQLLVTDGEDFMESEDFERAVLSYFEALGQFCVPQEINGNQVANHVRTQLLAKLEYRTLSAGDALAKAVGDAYPCN